MNKTWKKMLALALTLCTVLGLMVPMAGAADASEYELPEIGPVTDLGEPMKRDNLSVGYFLEMITYGNKQYVLALGKSGTLYVFSLTDYLNGEENVYGNYIYDSQPLAGGSPNHIVVDSKNIAYISDGKGITVYDISSKTAQVQKISLPKSASGLTVDGDDNLYVAADGGYVYKVKNNNGTYSISWTADFSAALTRMSGIIYADGYVYACGTDGDASYFYKLDPADGRLEKEPLKDTRVSSLIYLSYADGKLFGGNTTSCNHMVIVDADTMTPTTITLKHTKNGPALTEEQYNENLSILGAVSAERDNCVYFIVSGTYGGFYQYSTKDHEAVRIGTRTARGLRFRNSYVTIEDPVSGKTGTFLVNANNTVPFFDQVAGGLSKPDLTGLWEGAPGTIDKTRHVGTGVSGTGPAVYIGGFRTASVAGYDPAAQVPMNNQVFSHGHAQLDATIVYNNKLYGGCYSSGYVFEYDPSDSSFRDLIPSEAVGDVTYSILLTQYGQLRIHALAAGDDKIFFSTVPDEGKLGGVLGWYDLSKDPDVEDPLTILKLADLVPADGVTNELGDQILISLVYDNGLLYGSSSTYGGGGGVTRTAEEGLLMVYDVNNKKLLGNFSVRAGVNPRSTMVFDLNNGDKIPEYINGIARDPASGKMWGVVDETIFSFSYDRTANTMTVTEEIDGRKSVFTASGNPNWFPHPILFDGAGHVIVDTDSICRYTLDGNNKLTQKTSLGIDSRSYALGTDGNLYVIISGHTKLWRVSLNPHSIVEDMITCAATGQNGITPTEAQAAYNALEDEDKSKVNASILRVLQTLQGAECQVENGDAISYATVAEATAAAGANTTISLLADYSGDIAVQGGATLDLAGYTVTGSVIVTDGIVKDSLGTGGIVLADSNDQISLVGATALPQIPLLDGDTYRFYSWDAKSLTSTKETDQVKFWFDLVLEDTEAYTLLSGNAQTHLDVYAWLYVDGTKQNASVVFDDAVKGWAAENHAGTDDYALYVGVTNIPNTVYDISVQPYIDIFGKKITLDKMDRDVAFIRAELKYGIYPNSN